jgi:hypothetical protein
MFQLTPHFMRSYDLLFSDGDLDIGDTNDQEILLIMEAAPGNFYFDPQLGVDVYRYIHSADAVARQRLRSIIDENMLFDNKDANINVLFPDDIEDVEDEEIRAILEDGKLYIGVS